MTIPEFLPLEYKNTLEKGSFTYESPSNIALVKYWGKHGVQLPKNPSLSFTLDTCVTTTQLYYSKREKPVEEGYDFQVVFEGAKKQSFKPKIEQFLDRALPYLPFLKEYTFTIETKNSFPHSSGIASSASGMSALAMCLIEMERAMRPEMTVSSFRRKASFISRLGSGSACRSIDGPVVVWGAHESLEQSSDLYGVPLPGKIAPVFEDFQDTILLIDKGEKQVSSTVGHNLMNNHPYASYRFQQANEHMDALISILEKGDLEAFIHLVELEALTLHAMMMTSDPYFILMKPNTLEVINKIWEFRRESLVPVCFTLDAGANVHVLYPKENAGQVLDFIKTQLLAYCQEGQYICDNVGKGARKL